MRRRALAMLATCLFAPSAWGLDGVRVGDCWTDYDGTNYCGGGSGGGSSYDGGSAYSYDPYYYSAYGDAAYKVGEAVGTVIADGIVAMFEAQAEATVAYTYNAQGNDLFAKGDYEGAIAAYKLALEHAPGDYYIQKNLKRAQVAMHQARGRALHEQGDLDGALAEYRQALAYDSSNRAIHQQIRLVEQKQAFKEVRRREQSLKMKMVEAEGNARAKAMKLARDLRDSTAADSDFALLKMPASAQEQRGLRIHEVPLPDASQRLPDPTLAERYESLRPYIAAAGEQVDKAKLMFWEGKMWLREQAAATGVDYVVDKAAAAVPIVGAAQRAMGMADETKALYQKVGAQHEETAQGVLDRLKGAVSDAADPNQRTTGEEIDGWLTSRAETYEKMGHDTYMEKYRGKAKGMLEGFQQQHEDLAAEEETGPAPAGTVPLEGLKSYDRQRQEYLKDGR